MQVDRRQWLAGSASLAMTAASGLQVRAQSAVPVPPTARIEPVTETFFARSVTDPYRWMETPTDPDWEPFMRGNAAHARALFDAIPGRQALHEAISAVTGATASARQPRPAGGKLFHGFRAEGAQSLALRVRDAGGDRVLVDPDAMTGPGGAHMSLDWWSPSPDGRHIAYGLSEAGGEDSVLHVMEVDSGMILPERIDRIQGVAPSWLPDGRGFFYNRLAGAPKGSVAYYQDSVCWLHILGADPAEDVRVLARGQYDAIPGDPFDFPFITADPASDHVVAGMFGGVRRENPTWSARLDDLMAGRPVWRPICGLEDEVIAIAHRGDDLWLVSTRDAENGRLLHTSASNPDIASAKVLVPEGDHVIEAVTATSDAVYVTIMDGGYHRLERIDRDGGRSPVALPFDGSIVQIGAATDTTDLYLVMGSWLEPTAIWRRAADGTLSDTGLSPRPDVDTSAYELTRDFATARDGTRVPVSIIARRGAPRDGSSPTMVEAYGAYQIVSSPGFDIRGLALLDRGGIQVVAHVRGGGEYGKRWWRAGRKQTKPNTWRDLIDVCEHLVREGWTSPGKLGIVGGSAGGIAIGRALTERPDLFAVAVPQVGTLNKLRSEFSQNGPTNIEEFGTVTTEDGFNGLYAMDSLHHVVDGTRYPAVLLTHGMTDPRVEPWHSGKMVARLRAAASPDSGPIVLRLDFDAGHGIGSTRDQFDAQRADIYAFFLQQVGHPEFRTA